jgi:hypothetical protein
MEFPKTLAECADPDGFVRVGVFIRKLGITDGYLKLLLKRHNVNEHKKLQGKSGSDKLFVRVLALNDALHLARIIKPEGRI